MRTNLQETQIKNLTSLNNIQPSIKTHKTQNNLLKTLRWMQKDKNLMTVKIHLSFIQHLEIMLLPSALHVLCLLMLSWRCNLWELLIPRNLLPKEPKKLLPKVKPISVETGSLSELMENLFPIKISKESITLSTLVSVTALIFAPIRLWS